RLRHPYGRGPHLCLSRGRAARARRREGGAAYRRLVLQRLDRRGAGRHGGCLDARPAAIAPSRRQGREGERRKEVMLALLLESALRPLLLGGAVWLGLKLLRVKNPHAHMTAWTLVLVASLAMPALMRLVTVTIPAAAPAPLAQIIWPAPPIAPPLLE